MSELELRCEMCDIALALGRRAKVAYVQGDRVEITRIRPMLHTAVDLATSYHRNEIDGDILGLDGPT